MKRKRSDRKRLYAFVSVVAVLLFISAGVFVYADIVATPGISLTATQDTYSSVFGASARQGVSHSINEIQGFSDLYRSLSGRISDLQNENNQLKSELEEKEKKIMFLAQLLGKDDEVRAFFDFSMKTSVFRTINVHNFLGSVRIRIEAVTNQKVSQCQIKKYGGQWTNFGDEKEKNRPRGSQYVTWRSWDPEDFAEAYLPPQTTPQVGENYIVYVKCKPEGISVYKPSDEGQRTIVTWNEV